jgi:hypothetical protein
MQEFVAPRYQYVAQRLAGAWIQKRVKSVLRVFDNVPISVH